MVRTVIPWLTSAVTLFGMWAIGQRKWWGWLVGLGNQVLWVTFIALFGAWGLAPLTGALILLYTRNLLKWRHEAVLVLAGGADAPSD